MAEAPGANVELDAPIGIAMSGGYPALAYHLGTLSYLNDPLACLRRGLSDAQVDGVPVSRASRGIQSPCPWIVPDRRHKR